MMQVRLLLDCDTNTRYNLPKNACLGSYGLAEDEDHPASSILSDRLAHNESMQESDSERKEDKFFANPIIPFEDSLPVTVRRRLRNRGMFLKLRAHEVSKQHLVFRS